MKVFRPRMAGNVFRSAGRGGLAGGVFYQLVSRGCSKNLGGRTRAKLPREARPPFLVDYWLSFAPCRRIGSALHVDRRRLGEPEREARLRRKLDVTLRGDERHGSSRGQADRPADGCSRGATGQGANQDTSAGSAAHPQQIVFLMAAANFAGRIGVNGIALPVNVHRLQREQQPWTALESYRFFGL